jgi:hypothetical protein
VKSFLISHLLPALLLLAATSPVAAQAPGEVSAATRPPLRPGEAPAALSARAAELFQLAGQRQWDGAAAMVSRQSRQLFSIPDDALPEAVLTHITFNPGRILQLELTRESWYHLAPYRRAPGENRPEGSEIFQMEILLLDEDYYPEMTLLWIFEDQEWHLLCDDIYRHYLNLEIPGDSRGICTRFMRLLRHGQWDEAAELVSTRAAQLPFSDSVANDKELIHSLTWVPGKDTFKKFILTFDRHSWCEIGQYNADQGWFEMLMHRLSSGEDRLSLIWVREAGTWKVFCDADYLRYFDLEPPERLPPALSEAVERYHVNYCRGFNRQWWDDWSDKSLWKAYELGSENLQARVPFSEFATFPDSLPVPRFSIKYRRLHGFARRDGGLVEVVVILRGGGPGARLEAPDTSLWIEVDGQWRRTTREVEAIRPVPPPTAH